MRKQHHTHFDRDGNLTIHAPRYRGQQVQLTETAEGYIIATLAANIRPLAGLSAVVGRIWPAAEYLTGNHRVRG